MAIEIRVPRLGWTMETGSFAGWLLEDGEEVQEGTPLFSVEGDKAIQEVEAVGSGILRIRPDGPAAGAEVDVGALLGYIAEPGEAVSFEPPKPSAPSEPTTAAQPAACVAASAAGATPVGREALRTAASPRARRVARELGVDWTSLRGSGRTGRIVERDVRGAAASVLPAGKVVPWTPLRKVIAERMHEGSSVAAPVTLAVEVDATSLVETKGRLKAADPERAPSYTDLLIAIVSRTLAEHPLLNARLESGRILLEDEVRLAFAVDVPDGLLVPVLRDAARKSLREISSGTKDLIARARTRRLEPAELQGGTFTLTNLGMFAVDAFTPILSLPQCAVLGVGRIVRKPAVVGDRIVPRDRMTLSLTFDHRVVDGAPAARFLTAVVGRIESGEPLSEG